MYVYIYIHTYIQLLTYIHTYIYYMYNLELIAVDSHRERADTSRSPVLGLSLRSFVPFPAPSGARSAAALASKLKDFEGSGISLLLMVFWWYRV